MNKFSSKLIIAALIVSLASCTGASSKKTSRSASNTLYKGHYKVGKPYKVSGQVYRPKKHNKYEESGIASWYGSGDGFHGRKTANGDRYNKRSLTAAHRTLPMPSVARVTNLANNKSVIVMINDRGPFSKKRIIDVSERAAELLDMKRSGHAKVKVQYLPKESKMLLASMGLDEVDGALAKRKISPDAYIEAANKNNYQVADAGSNDYVESSNKFDKNLFIQIGSYKLRKSAEKAAGQVAKLGKCDIKQVSVNDGDLYRLRLGPIDNRSKANKLLSKILTLGNESAVIVADNAKY